MKLTLQGLPDAAEEDRAPLVAEGDEAALVWVLQEL